MDWLQWYNLLCMYKAHNIINYGCAVFSLHCAHCHFCPDNRGLVDAWLKTTKNVSCKFVLESVFYNIRKIFSHNSILFNVKLFEIVNFPWWIRKKKENRIQIWHCNFLLNISWIIFSLISFSSYASFDFGRSSQK